MFTNYLVTGATGFLGLTVVRMLAARGERVTALVLKGDASAARLPRRRTRFLRKRRRQGQSRGFLFLLR